MMPRYHLRQIAAVLVMTTPAFADTPGNQDQPSPFDTILQRVTAATSSDDWKKGGWHDRQLASALSEVIDRLQKVTGNKNIKLPATFDTVRPALGRNGSRISYLRSGLFVTRRGKVSHANNSVILAEESIEVSHARNCLIIARGAVDVGHGGRNVIIAGHFIHTSHDGHPDPRNGDGPNGSVLISGSVVDVSHAGDTVISAPLAVTIGFSTNGTFINSPNCNISHESNSTGASDKSSVWPVVRPQHPLIAKLNITQIVPPDDSGEGALVATKHTDVETVIRIDDVIPHATAELKGWKLVFVADAFALFANDGQYASVYIDPHN